jgi:hypothetical protein
MQSPRFVSEARVERFLQAERNMQHARRFCSGVLDPLPPSLHSSKMIGRDVPPPYGFLSTMTDHRRLFTGHRFNSQCQAAQQANDWASTAVPLCTFDFVGHAGL